MSNQISCSKPDLLCQHHLHRESICLNIPYQLVLASSWQYVLVVSTALLLSYMETFLLNMLDVFLVSLQCFDTAVEEPQRAINAVHVETQSAENSIGVVKLMGRYSGFIAMYATLASRDVDSCLIP